MRYQLPSGVAWRRIGREVVILRTASGDYYSVADCAADAWEWFSEGADVKTAAARCAKSYAVSQARAEKDVANLAAKLAGLGLLEESDAPAPKLKSAQRVPARRLPYAELHVNTHSRLEQTPPYAWATY